MAGVVVPPVPHKTPLIDAKSGFLSSAWAAWFRELYNRVGGSVALSNTELADLAGVDLTPIEAQIASLQSSVASLQNRMNELNQDPVP